MKIRAWMKAVPLAIVLIASLTLPAAGQNVTATVTGTVTDPSGGVVVDAVVIAENAKTNVEYPTRSNKVGVYNISGLPIGTYIVRFEATGFGKTNSKPFVVEAGQIARVDVELLVATHDTEITVTEVVPILQRDSSSVETTIPGATIQQLPLNGRNVAQLAVLSPGVQTHSPDTFNSPKQSSDSGRPYVNGQREQSNNYMLDGIDQNEAVDNLIAYYPSPDALAEMRIETNNYSAEFGNVAGGVITAITKSGDNVFHGSAFEFARNDKFDANSWANNKSGAKKADLNQHIFGGTLSGPIVKNRIFFFADYQGQKTDRPGEVAVTVAPDNFRDGSAFGISPSQFSPIAQRLLSDTTAYPRANRPGLAVGNYVSTNNTTTRNHQGDLKLDANLGPNDNLFIRGSIGKYDTSLSKTAIPTFMGNGYLSDAQNVGFNWTHSFNPTTVNELRLGYSHVTIENSPIDSSGLGNYNATLGIAGGQAVPGLSALVFGGDLSTIGNASANQNTNDKTIQVSEKLSFSKGRHYVSVGGQLIHYDMGQLYATNSGLLGTFAYDNFGSFLLDHVSRKQVLLNTPGSGLDAGQWTQQQNRLGLFVQDDFKPNSNLTLNLGLRWEYASPITEKDDKQVNYDYATGAILRPGDAGLGDALYKSYKGGFSPRVGFAYTLNPKTVVRGGFGLVQYQEGTGANCRLPINPPFYSEVAQAYPGATGSAAVGFTDIGAGAAPSIGSVQVRAWQTDLRPQLTKQWNFFVERQLTSSTSLNVGYVGSRSSHVITFNDANSPLSGQQAGRDPRRIPSLGFMRYTASDGIINYDGLQTSVRHRMAHGLEFLASYTFSKTLADNQGFYGPGWGGRSANQGTAGQQGDGNYDAYNHALDYGPSWFSSTHNATLSMNYHLPIGKGRSVGGDWGGLTQALLGGWNVSGILSVRSGLPITATDTAGWGAGPSNNSGFGVERPNLTGAGITTGASKEELLTGAKYLNPAAFSPNVVSGAHGDSGVGVARGPAFYNLDAGIDKNFDLGGSRYVTIRVEAFNVLNHTNLGLPNRNLNFNRGDGSFAVDSSFGRIDETANGSRVLEFAAKFVF
jgi:outer membrane receptor protein involved in Fe transport